MPIKGKPNDSYSLTSLNKFKTRFDSKVLPGIVIHDGDFKIENNIIYIPIFAIDWYLK